MSIQFSGLGSGLNISDWITELVAVKQTAVTSLESKLSTVNNRSKNLTSLKSQYSSFNTILNKLADSKLGSASDVFSQSKASSSNESILTVSANNDAINQTLDVFIERLATSSSATGLNTIGNNITEDTKFGDLANGAVKEGSFSFYVDNQKFTIEVNKEDTLGDIKDKMVDITKSDENPNGLISVDISGGKFSVDAGGKSLALGAAQDKSNFISVLSLKQNQGTNSYESSTAITDLNLNAKLIGPDSPFGGALQEGTFKIGDATFTIDENTTLNSLMQKINSNSDAGVEARLNPSTGQFELTAKSTGAFSIGMENGSSNFLELVGLMNGNRMADGTQTLGENALLKINGREVESFSNTVTSETTGLSGLVFNLNDVSEAGKSVKIKVEQDNSSVLSAVKDLISGFNSTLNQTIDLMSNDSTMKYDSGLSSIRAKLRGSASYGISGNGEFSNLRDIGITTKSVDKDGSAKTSELQIDETKFLAALEKDPEAVKRLLIGSEDGSETGVVGQIKDVVNTTLHATEGYFANKSESLQKQITSLNDQITKKQNSVEVYRKQITNKFNAMDAMISKLNNQYSSLLSMF